MLIALFALTQLPIFRATPTTLSSSSSPLSPLSASQPPPPPSLSLSPFPKSSRCGKSEEPTTTSITSKINNSTFKMSSQQDQQDQAVNGNLSDGKSVEIINFKPYDKQHCHLIKTNHTKVLATGGVQTRGSSKVKLKNVVDYKWERKYYYPGHLVAVHRDGKHLAYAINVNNKATGMEGMVRVCNISSTLRALIKGMSGEVLDLQFSYTERDRILAVIDMSSLFVYKIDQIDGNLLCNLVLKVEDPIDSYVPEFDMVSWCPYVSSTTSSTNNNNSTSAAPAGGAANEEDDENQLLIWSRSSQFQCFHVKMIVNEHGRGKIQPGALDTGYLKIREDSLITCVALSPDGTTVAAACADGLVRFYQIYLFDVRNHRCLHEWKPHDGKKVDSLFFLDNINKPVEESYWQNVITTSDFNTEIKLWNCTLWECLQTINVVASAAVPQPIQLGKFIAGIDRSANYLVLSSLDSLAVYVMEISNGRDDHTVGGSSESDAENDDPNETNNGAVDGTKRIQSIAEFKLSSGILSFSIVNASMRKMKSTTDTSYYPFEEPDDYDDESTVQNALVLHMFVVQAKSLQECQIIYQPLREEKTKLGERDRRSLTGSSTAKSSASPDELSDIKQLDALDALFGKSAKRASAGSSSAVVAVAVATATAAPSNETNEVKSRSSSPQYTSNVYPQHLNLMTPDAFSATGTGGSSTTTSAAAVVVATTTNNSQASANAVGTAESNSVSSGADTINSQVLNTLRMLATVAGAGTGDSNSNANLLNLMNNTLIEDREQQKLKEKIDSRKKFISIDRNPEILASGGSSPSREVQEIMATQDDVDTYEAELENLDDDDDEDEEEEEEDVELEPVDWMPKKSAELQNAAQIMSQAVQHKNNGNVPPTLGGNTSSSSSSNNNTNTSVSSNSNNNTVTTLNSSNASNSSHNATAIVSGVKVDQHSSGSSETNAKLDQLLGLVKAQSQQLNKLENEVATLQLQQQQMAAKTDPNSSSASLEPKTVNQLAYKIEMQLSKLMEQYLKRYENEHKKKLAEFLQARDSQNLELRESVLQVLNQYVMNHFTDIVGNFLNLELQRQIVPRVNAKMDQLQNQMQVEIVQKLNVFDKTVKENIAQVCKSKQFLDSFGKSVLLGVQASLQIAFVDSMSSTLIPAYEKSSQNMFKQLHDAFSVGIKDFMVQFNTYLQHMPQPHVHSEELNNKLGSLKQLVETNLLKHRTELTDAMLETQREVKSLEILLARQVQETIRVELRKHLEQQNLAMRSQAATPAPTYDIRDTIKQLLLAGQINKAFHQALLANDLNLVEFTLRHTDHSQAFAPEGCRLEQKVLLSLIQQISADMSNHNELKQSYLNEAILAINMSDPITREHAPKVLSELYRSCQHFIKNSPKNTQCSNVRLLMKAITTYRDQFK
ncbi:enhancer of mRNA-decapping protein 4 homolog [Drosophila tropicalis]|uniref:enhancer of mRNA-decapping protein 4 homolog n=1 Tax=Drosophila tropicalis TaxID=46794 RepID=UPI0035ABFA9C